MLHVAGIALYLAHRGDAAAAGGLAGSGALAYVLGMRHAFDADHIAAIDDTTRVMLMRGPTLRGCRLLLRHGPLDGRRHPGAARGRAAGRISQTQVDSMR